jgi:hypothetical protein
MNVYSWKECAGFERACRDIGVSEFLQHVNARYQMK